MVDKGYGLRVIGVGGIYVSLRVGLQIRSNMG